MEFDELNPLETMDNEMDTPVVAAVDAVTNKDDPEVQQRYKMMLTLWLSLCVFGFVWFVTKVMRGRQRIRYNFQSIEEQLRRMQATIEERERAQAENSITDSTESSYNTELMNASSEPKVSPDAQRLLEKLSHTFENESEDALENVEEREEIENGNHDQQTLENSEINGNVNSVDNETINSRRRKFIDGIEAKIDSNNVDLIRDTIEDIINEGVHEIDSFVASSEHSKKDN